MVTGVILAGGMSRRMGQNKALLKLGNDTFIAHIIRSLQSITDELLIITNTPEEYKHLNIKIHKDIIPNSGVLGGIHAGLSYASHETVICVGCDNPFLQPRLLSYLVSILGEHDAVIPYTHEHPTSQTKKSREILHTLCAVYSIRCLPIIEQMLNKPDLRAHAIREYAKVLTPNPDIWKKYDPDGLSFFNVNTPEEYEIAQTIFKSL